MNAEHKKNSPSSETAIGNFFDLFGEPKRRTTLFEKGLKDTLTPSCISAILNSANARSCLSLRGTLTPEQLLRLGLDRISLHDGIILIGNVSTLTAFLLDLATFNIE